MMETEKGDIIDLTSDHEEDNRSILLQNLPLAPQLPDPYSSIAHLSHSSTMTNGALLSAGSSRPQLPRAISAPPHSILPAAQYSTSPYSSSQFGNSRTLIDSFI